MLRRADVELAACHFEHLLHQARQFLLDTVRLGQQRGGIDPDAGAFDVDKHGHERQFERLIDAGQLLRVELFAKKGCELPDEVGTLARVIDRGLHWNLGERQRLDALPADVLLGDSFVSRVLERQILEAMRRPRGIEEITQEHRVGAQAVQGHTMPAEYDRVELQVVARLDDVGVGKQRSKARYRIIEGHRRHAAKRMVADRHIVGIARRR